MRIDCHHHFWHYVPRELPWIDNDVPGLVAYFHAALDHAADARLSPS